MAAATPIRAPNYVSHQPRRGLQNTQNYEPWCIHLWLRVWTEVRMYNVLVNKIVQLGIYMMFI